MAETDELYVALAAAIGDGTFAGASFEDWALRVFRHQFARNAPYRAYCERRGMTPAGVARWEDVPAVPTLAFRRVDLACGEPEIVFRTAPMVWLSSRPMCRHVLPPSIDL